MEQKDQHIEILELAISREIESINLYLAMAEYFSQNEVSRTFVDIANEELKHKQNLELEVIKLGFTIKTGQDFSEAPAKDTDLAERLMLDEMDHRNLLEMAINKEEESFRFYVDLLESVEGHLSREILYSLAQEEAGHKFRFQSEYDLLSREKN